ncbi:hypothetical protein AgCh_035628 [Apium graveolens]
MGASTKCVISLKSGITMVLVVAMIVVLLQISDHQVQEHGANCSGTLSSLTTCAPFVVPGANNSYSLQPPSTDLLRWHPKYKPNAQKGNKPTKWNKHGGIRHVNITQGSTDQTALGLLNLTINESFVSRHVTFHEHIMPLNSNIDKSYMQPLPVKMPFVPTVLCYDDETEPAQTLNHVPLPPTIHASTVISIRQIDKTH